MLFLHEALAHGQVLHPGAVAVQVSAAWVQPVGQVTAWSQDCASHAVVQAHELAQLILPSHELPVHATSQLPVPQVMSLRQEPLLQSTSQPPAPHVIASLHEAMP